MDKKQQKEYDARRWAALSAEEKKAAGAKAYERVKRVRAEHLPIFQAFKEEQGCALCGEKNHRCLDFHHKDPTEKSFVVSEHMVKNLKALWAEVAKCEVLCANCHRKYHYRGEEG